MAQGGTTITATMGMNTQPAVQALQQLPQHVKNALNQATTHTKQFSSDFTELFKMPLGERRAHRAFESLSRGLLDVGQNSESAIRSVGNFGRAISTGLAGGAIIGGVTLLAEEFVKLNEEALKTEETIHKIVSTAAQTGGFRPLEEMKSSFGEATQQSQMLYEQIVKIRSTKGLGIIGADLTAMLKGFMPDLKGFLLGGPTSARAKEAAFVEEQRQTLLKAQSDTISEMAKKEREVSQVEEIRYRVGERAAQAAAEELKHKEILHQVESAAAKSGVQKSEEAAAENQRFAQVTRRNQEQAAAEERTFQGRLKQGRLAAREIADEGRLANIQNSALTAEEKALEVARERSEISVDRIESARAEVDAAEEELAVAKNIGVEEERKARLRLQSAQNAEAEARNVAKGAAAGVADVRANQLLAAGREEEMSPQEKYAQLQQRHKQYEGLMRAAARQGIRGDLIEPPEYGEAGYDPLRKFKAAAAQEEMARQQEMEAEKRQQDVKREAESPTVQAITKIGGDVAAIKELIGGKGAPSGQPPITPGQPQPQVGGAGGQQGTQATTGIRPETMQELGITPGEPNVDWAKVQEIQSNADAYNAYWNSPEVQEAIRGEQAIGQEALQPPSEAEAARREYQERGLEPGPLAPTPEGQELRDTAEWRREMYEQRGLRPGPLGENLLPELPPQPEVPQQPPQPTPSGHPTPAPLSQPITQNEMDALLAKYWA